MAKAKRVRWECPDGLHPGVLGSTRPPADATVRFCLDCSADSGRLVKRTAPALERKRAAKTVARETREQERRRRDRDERERALKVTVLDYESGEVELDAGELLKAAWRTSAIRERLADHWRYPGRQSVPALTIRRGRPDAGRAVRPIGPDQADRGRDRDAMSGHAKQWSEQIVLTVAPGLGREWLEAIVVHEAAHVAAVETAHGPAWRSTYIRAMRELYGVEVRNGGQANWRLDEDITLALRARGRES